MGTCELCRGDGFIAIGTDVQECPLYIGTGEAEEGEPHDAPGEGERKETDP